MYTNNLNNKQTFEQKNKIKLNLKCKPIVDADIDDDYYDDDDEEVFLCVLNMCFLIILCCICKS